ncbi:MAG: hypothetical protein C5B51_00520 [Terriglobia bacterium]|nr:MAG: hypothetical protein C5B51_00520 [Terriglobia bacterium]
MSRYFWLAVFVAQLARADQPATATASSEEYKIVLFSDFQCPFCRQFSQPIRDLMNKGVDGVQAKVTFKNFPLSFHPDAQLAAQAAMAAKEQGKFWEMHDLLFANQLALKRDNLVDYAKRLGLDIARFKKDLDSDQIKQTIASEQAEGTKLAVNGTPTFFLNGVSYSGTRSFDEMKQLLQKEHKRIQAVTEITDSLLSRGPADAAVTVEFFADLESPVSRPAEAVIEELLKQYPDRVRLQFRNFPLAFHPQAPLAHEAALIAAKGGRFWEFTSYILEHQNSLREQDLITYAGQLGFDETKFVQTLHDHRYAPRVDADVSDGFRRGIRGSPVIFVNANRIDGVPSLKTLTEYVEAELAKK